jgi:hypothetical protein
MTISRVVSSRFFIAGCLFLAAGVLAVAWAMNLMESIYGYRSPLRYYPPAVQEPLGHAVSQRVVIVLVDGLTDATARDPEVMPYLETLRGKGASAVMHSRPLSYSQPGYSTLMIGAWPDINDGPAINLDYEKIPSWTQDNLFAAVHRVGGRTAIAAHYTFEKLLPRTDVNDSFYTEDCNQAGDEQIFPKALEWLQAGGQSLLLIHLCQVDDAGDYLGGPKAQPWADAAARVDGMIEKIAAKLDLTKDTLLIVSDHGHLDIGGHGGPEAMNLIEPFILVGAGVKPGDYGDVQMVDVAPTTAALLGAAIPATSQGRVLNSMLALDPAVSAGLTAAEETQQKQLFEYYTRAIGTSASIPESGDPVTKYETGIERARDNRLSEEVMGRVFLILVPIAAAVIFAWKFRGRKLLERVLLFLLYALVFTAVYVLAFRQTFSLTGVQSQTGMILAIVVPSAAGFLAAWLANIYLRRFFTEGPEAIAENTLALAGVFIVLLAIPVAVHFVLNGTLARWTMPESNTGFFALLSMIQILTLAVFGGLLAGGAALGKHLYDRRNAPGKERMNFVRAPSKKETGPRPTQGKKRTGRGSGRKK